MDQNISPREVQKVLHQKNIDIVLAQYVDIYGAPKAKAIPIAHFEDFATTGAMFAPFAISGMGLGPEQGDIAAIPDLSTLTILPWKKNVARFACNIHVNGKPWRFCSRTILQKVIAKAAEKNLLPRIGTEPEFFLVRKNNNGIEVADSQDDLQKPCYDLKGLTRSLSFLESLISNIKELGWDAEAADHEDANGQFEVNFRFDNCVIAADKLTFVKYMIAMLANQLGFIATFMPKPFLDKTGNGSHIHVSLWDIKGEKNLFLDENDGNGLGLSQLAYNYIGGLLKHARAYIAFSAPTVNSYKRLFGAGSISGSTWAPVCVTYGGNNRTQMLRIPAPGRIEDRSVDGASNPYLAAAAALSAGLDGVDKKIDPGQRNDLNMFEVPRSELKKMGAQLLPHTLEEALNELENDDFILDSLGREFCEYYIEFKRQEWHDYHSHVSDWEYKKYLTLV